MTTTTEYGTWYSVMGISAEANPGAYIYAALGDTVQEFDVDGIEQEFRSRIADALYGTGISLDGAEFNGPVYPDDAETAAQEAIDLHDVIEDIDLYEFAPRFEWDAIVATCQAGMEARDRLKQCAADLVPARYSESELARRAGVDRMTVRNWLGKR